MEVWDNSKKLWKHSQTWTHVKYISQHFSFSQIFTHDRNTVHVFFCFQLTGFVRVLENLESHGILLWHFPGLERPGKRPLVLESSGNPLNSATNVKCMEVSKENNSLLILRSWDCRG